MNGTEDEASVRAAQKREWAAQQMAAFSLWNDRREQIVRNALEAGFTTTYIAQSMGIARSTINRIKKRITSSASQS